MPRNDKRVPSLTTKRIFKEAQSRCPFCGESDVALLDIHHIYPRRESGPNEASNLILACKNCHARIEVGEISLEQVLSRKISLMALGGSGPEPPSSGGTVTVNGDVTSSVVANNVTVKGSTKRRIRVEYPSGSIGANLELRNYIDYLVKKYIDFRKADPSFGIRKPFFPGRIHIEIEETFKRKTFFIPDQLFTELVKYLHGRINQTALGKRNSASGRSNYRTFAEFQAMVIPAGNPD